VLAAIGLVLPAALDLVPILTAIAASGVVLLISAPARPTCGAASRRCGR
jgi:hypothetical protein